MSYGLKPGISILAVWICTCAYAGSDTSLLKGAVEAPQEAAVENGRYQIRQEKPFITIKKLPTTKPITRASSSSRVPTSETKETKLVQETPLNNTEKPLEPPSMADQMKGLVMGEQQPALEAYREQVHPDDVRLNRLEANITPGYLYLDSKSIYSFRNYQLFAPFVQLGARIWLTPFIGLYGNYGTTFGGDISESNSNSAHIAVTQEVSNLGINFRKFYGYSRKSNSLIFGLHYFESKFSVPGDNTHRTKNRSSGLGFNFEARFPTAPGYSWILGAELQPRLSHSEMATGADIRSGSSPQSSRVAFDAGGEFKLSRENQIIWNLSFGIEKVQFTGSANTLDPETSTTPSGVAVTQTTSLLSLGYRWGH